MTEGKKRAALRKELRKRKKGSRKAKKRVLMATEVLAAWKQAQKPKNPEQISEEELREFSKKLLKLSPGEVES